MMPSSSSTTSSTSSVSDSTQQQTNVNLEQKTKLLNLLKKEVKHIMEESVMLKSIYEDSSTVTSLCAVIDTCLSMGLKRRALGLFKTSSTMALIQKVAKDNKDADEVMKKLNEAEQNNSRRTHSSGDSHASRLSRMATLEKVNSGSNLAMLTRFLWIKIALFEKKLQRIVSFLVQEADRYYTRDSLVADPDFGPIISSLLVGPCALEYSKIKANEQSWCDLPANELVQRHKISSGSTGSMGSSQSGYSISSPQHLQAKRSLSHACSVINVDESSRSIPSQAREYVESLHQNHKESLLYGKNNVFVLPKDSAKPQAGYLSLHQNYVTLNNNTNGQVSNSSGLSLKWTPNKLMNGSTIEDKNESWQQAVSVDISSILFMHCHQDKDESGTLIMIASDGTQQPPLQFPPGGHLVQFLSCLEASLSPEGGYLEPPVSSLEATNLSRKNSTCQPPENLDGKEEEEDNSLGGRARRILPLLRRRKDIKETSPKVDEVDASDSGKPTTPSICLPGNISSGGDYVFKIQTPRTPFSTPSSGQLLNPPGGPMVNPFIASLRAPSSAPPDVMSTSSVSLPGTNINTGGEKLIKTRSDWFSNLFSPSKSRHNSASTDTSRSISLSEYSGPSSMNGNSENPGSNNSGSNTHVQGDFNEEDEILEVTEEKEEEEKDSTTPTEPISTLCHTMSRQIISRAFYGWLSHCRHIKTVREHLSGLAFHQIPQADLAEQFRGGLTKEAWNKAKSILQGSKDLNANQEQEENLVNDTISDVYKRVYYGGIEPSIRNQVWPYLLRHYKWTFSQTQIAEVDKKNRSSYEHKLSDWMSIEAIVKQRDKETTAANIAKLSGASMSIDNFSCSHSINMSNEVFESIDEVSSRTASADKISTITEVTENENSTSHSEKTRMKLLSTQSEPPNDTQTRKELLGSDEGISGSHEALGKHNVVVHYDTDGETSSLKDKLPASEMENGLFCKPLASPAKKFTGSGSLRRRKRNIKRVAEIDEDTPGATNQTLTCTQDIRYKITTPSLDSGHPELSLSGADEEDHENEVDFKEIEELQHLTQKISTLGVTMNINGDLKDDTISSSSTCQSPLSSEGGVFPQELIENFALNMHRIDKDVQRCDRNLAYFTPENLDKLRNIITTYVWENLDIGYMQGMCDLVAPLLVTFDDEALTHSCFSNLMERMICNFPNGNQMDDNFANMRSLIHVLDQTLYDSIQKNGDFSHFYFCYRWFLLDFKREFTYHEIYLVWETIWASSKVTSSHFFLFVALALVENYRDIILDRNMDFTDIIKFFNEMAEKHQAEEILQIARDQVLKLQTLITDK